MAEHIALLTSSPRGTPYCSAQDEAAAAWPPEVVKGGICRASGENSKVGELASRAFDFNPKTKWLDLCGASAACPAWLEYRLVPDHVGGPVVVASYSVTSANDHPERDPTAWVLEGVAAIDEHDSDADHIWQILDVQDGVNFTKRFQKIQFQVPFLTPCYRWRLRISSTRGEGAMVQLSCWTLYKAPTGPGNRPKRPRQGVTGVGEVQSAPKISKDGLPARPAMLMPPQLRGRSNVVTLGVARPRLTLPRNLNLLSDRVPHLEASEMEEAVRD